ncbi:MAG: hypothetical protein ABSC51_10095 [Gaiellaceae bacterium]|jgi:Tol biopolymer transport system component
MPRSSEEILAPARSELARGRPRAALKELELARSELFGSADVDGLGELLELARGVRTLDPVDVQTRERLLLATEESIEGLSPGAAVETTRTQTAAAPAAPNAQFTPYGLLSTEQILAPARTAIERGESGRALRGLEQARRKLLARADLDGLGELIELTQRLPLTKPRYAKKQGVLIDAARQNVRFLSRRAAIMAGETWSDPFTSAGPKTRSFTPPPMTRREKLIAAAIVVALAGGITTWALVKRAPQRIAHAINCPTGQQGGPTWSPDGKQIAFAKNGDCGTQIMVVSARGGRPRTVTSDYGALPDWSPDGSEILYRSRNGFSVVPAQGGRSRLLRSDDGDMGATWSPDGKEIAFVHGLDPFQNSEAFSYHSTLYVMNSDGSSSRRLLGHSCNPGTPDWSKDGGRLAFTCNNGVYVMRLANRSLVCVEFGDYSSSYSPRVSPSWSSDDRRIAIGYGGIRIVNADGSGNERELHEWDSVTDVAWSPNGRRLAFVVAGYGPKVNGLYVIDRDGSHCKRLISL